ncbi:MAG: DUF6285 domain-containing protein [Steroidobacteraceae bacterium]
MTRRPDLQDLEHGLAAYRDSPAATATDAAAVYEQRVARNLEEIAQRERGSGPPARAAEAGRLAALLGHAGSFDELQSELCRRIATGAIDECDAGLMAHLRATVMAQVAIDSPRYWSFVAAQRRGGR